MKLKFLLTAVLLLATTSVFAQAPEVEEIPVAPEAHGKPALYTGYIPFTAAGSVWSEVGTISPVEHNNLIATIGANQTVNIFQRSIFSLTPYVGGGATFDTAGHEWNNEIQGSLGIRINVAVPHGVISVGEALTYDNRFRIHDVTTGTTHFVSYWFGWGIPATEHRYPGSTWGTYGVISPLEPHNKVLYGYVQQGVVVGHIGTDRHPIIGFAELTGAKDDNYYDWNNFYRPGVGFKVALNHGLELGGSYSHETRYLSNEQANGMTVFLKWESDWSLLGGK